MALLLRVLRNLPLVLLSPFLWAAAAILITLTDIAFRLFGRVRPPVNRRPDNSAASAVIPNWNGRDLLEKYLPPLIEAMAGNPRNEIVVVDNGSADGSAEYVRNTFPTVRLVELPVNLGFGGGSNTGFEAARNDIVILLNSDMRVDRNFLQPLLDAFTDESVFAVSSQIFFTDPAKKREETGLTQGWWSNGFLRIRHVEDDAVNEPFPCFYPEAALQLSTAANSWNWEASTTSCGPSTWRIPISATWPGNAAGKCTTSRPARCGMSTAGRSARSSRRLTWKASSTRT